MSNDINKLKQRLEIRKYLVFAGMFLLFLGAMWLIFAPSEEEKKKEEKNAGFNTELPDPREAGIEGDKIAAYEHELTQYAMQRLKEIPGMRIFGEAEDKGSVISFLVGDIHHFDMGTLLDRLGIAVRTGHHCAQPLMQRLGIEGTVRASFGLYNTREEIDVLVAGIVRVSRMF